jgi:hypothetical protein
LAREHNIETVAPHDRHTLPAEAFVKMLLITRMELVDAQLVHARLTICGRGAEKAQPHKNPGSGHIKKLLGV